MKPLIVLLVSFLTALAIIYFVNDVPDLALAGRIAMAAMLLFTSLGHFMFTKGMAAMLPASVPGREAIVLVTGIMEILFAIGLLIKQVQLFTATCLIIFFIVLLPANIYAAIKRVNYEKPGQPGKGPAYLWIRIPMQILFIAWVYFSAYNPISPGAF